VLNLLQCYRKCSRACLVSLAGRG